MNREGVCGICGETKKLSFEHLPPESAFNNQRTKVQTYEQALSKTTYGKILQNGIGDYTLCESCNSKTGRWYVNEYKNWVYQAAKLLLLADGEPRLSYIYHGFPSRFFKQIITIFASVEYPHLTQRRDEIKRYLLNPRSREIDPKLRVYAYYNPSTLARKSGLQGIFSSETGKGHIFSEFAFFPFGFVLVDDAEPPDARLTDITFLADYSYDDFRNVPLNLPALPVIHPTTGVYHPIEDVRGKVQFELPP